VRGKRERERGNGEDGKRGRREKKER